jgi:putative oxidoreductase
VRAIGACELAAAIGLILPSLTGIRPDLTPLAALGLLTIMVLAMAFHISRGEPQMIPMNMVLGGIAAFVASGRHTKAPIESRSG